MTASEVAAFGALGISILMAVINVIEKLWGGGNALAAKFHTLDKETSAALSALDAKLSLRIDEYEDVARVGFEGMKSSIHTMQLATLEFRNKMLEDLRDYIRKDDYNAGIGDVKRDVQTGFRDVSERLGQMQDLIMYANPDLAHRRPELPKAR